MLILGIESTCDETGVAIVENGIKVIKSELASSAGIQAKFGGIVPEVAARQQLRDIIPALKTVLGGNNPRKIDAIAVSSGPGLIGSLLVGVETAKALSFVWNKPLVGVNHLSAHLYSNWIEKQATPQFPLLGLVISGGHTDLVYMKGHDDFKILGSTLDDAAGEAFDKVARFLGLPYPGGPQIENMASKYTRAKHVNPFPKSMAKKDSFDFSFSGIKTAVVRFVEKNKILSDKSGIPQVCYFFEEAVIESIANKITSALDQYMVKSLAVGGGVAANVKLRRKIASVAKSRNVKVFFPNKGLSVDNGAMIAAAAFFAGKPSDPLTIQAESGAYFS